MKTQQDCRLRMVALDNLQAMCARISGTCHVYEVSKVSRSRVHVTYSNPDEYGNPQPVTAVFPCYPSVWQPEDVDNPRVVLDCIRLIGPRSDAYRADWGMFEPLESCPTLWRNEGTWETHQDILTRQQRTLDGPCHSCTVCNAKTHSPSGR